LNRSACSADGRVRIGQVGPGVWTVATAAAGVFQAGALVGRFAGSGGQAGVAAVPAFGALRLDQFGGAQAAQESGVDAQGHAVGGVVLIAGSALSPVEWRGLTALFWSVGTCTSASHSP
jgi:hypothetical protein